MGHPQPFSMHRVQGGKGAKTRVSTGDDVRTSMKNGIQKPGILFYRQTGMGSFFPPRSLRSHQQHCALMNTAGQYWRSGGRGISLYQVGGLSSHLASNEGRRAQQARLPCFYFSSRE